MATNEQQAPVSLAWDTLCQVNFACTQNDVAVVRRLQVGNDTDHPLAGMRITLRSMPPVIRQKNWRLDRIAPRAAHEISDVGVELDTQRLKELNEAEVGELELRVEGEGIEPIIQRRPIRFLARDEWGGLSDMAQLLAAFVAPSELPVAKLLKNASVVLEENGYSGALDGYQSGDPARAYLLAGAIWSAATALRLSYAEPPASFEREGQKIRSPQRIAEEGLATCLDTTLLLAAGFEAAGLNPVVLFSQGHAWVGVWIQQKDFGHVAERDVVAVRKAVQAHELVPIETTLLTQRPAVVFKAAEDEGRRRLAEDREAEFVMAVDISRSRAAGIRPQSSARTQPFDEEPPAHEATAAALPERPDFGRLPGEALDDEPKTPQGRIERWQRKLLDLSLRNRLLNFVASKQTVPFRCPDVAALEDALAGNAKFRAVSLIDENPFGDRTLSPSDRRRIEEQVAREAFDKKQIVVPLAGEEMNKRLLMLFRRANSDMQEGGTNTLFLAAGFLRWRKADGESRVYRAPLLLIPVKLERRSAQSAFRIAHHEDEVRINFTLLEFLKRDFDIRVPALEEDLPRDESGIDVGRIFESMRWKVKDVAHFEVVEEVALSTFSFSKYLMWKDLVDREERLRESRLVKHLIDGPEDRPEGRSSAGFAPSIDRDRLIDRGQECNPGSLFAPLPADSSQLAAVRAAANGLDFYLVGPPGTGKSQTIANMIAQCLAEGRSVLFVAEKAAALDVVHRRLVAAGLGDAVLELHSNKTDRKSVLAQLGRGWDRLSAGTDAKWVRITDSLKVSRDRLNAYARALHAKGSQGFSVFVAIGRVANRGEACFEVSYESKNAHDEESYRRLVALAAETARVHGVVAPEPASAALELVEQAQWSHQWERSFLKQVGGFRASLEALREAEGALARALGLRADPALQAQRRAIIQALAPRAGDDALDLAAVPDLPPARLSALAESLAESVAAYFAAKSEAEANYPLKTIRRMPVEDIEADWREAQTKFWPASLFARRKAKKRLQTYADRGGANPCVDIGALISMKEQDAAIRENPLGVLAGADEARDVERTAEMARQAIALREALGALRDEVEDEATFRSAIGDLAAGVDGPMLAALKHYLEREAAALESEEAFVELGGKPSPGASAAWIERQLTIIETESSRLADWTRWLETRNRAVSNGLEPLVSALADRRMGRMGRMGRMEESAAEAFERAYAAWWLPLAMDDSDELRRFRHWDHEAAIEAFRKLDDETAALTAGEVMRRIRHELPARDGVPKKSELGVLRHQLNLKRPSMPIRRLLENLPETFGKLAPCVLMSPLSVAQYLPADRAAFDVVIFDEASQITTWDAIGAIARGRQTIVVGDPKQLPPTNFFGRADDEDEALPEIERDMPSILDEVAAAGVAERRLDWHYRSRDEALIAFSNWFYYGGRLVTFPAPSTDSNALRFHKVDGVYVPGSGGRVNPREAAAVAEMVSQRLAGWLQLPEEDRLTLGVITFNAEQQSLILDMLDSKRRENAELEWFFSADREEPVIVKNLENIQGDERDVMLFSVTFGPDGQGRLTMNFGPLNNAGGERRLNVAATRARREMHVFASLSAEQIDLARTQAQGVHHLKTFLDYAERGAEALPAHDQGSLGPAENAFEDAVAKAIERRGWEVRTQIGVSSFRIDLAIVHPDRAGSYLCGIECDGASYHSSATARDRDKTRQAVLEGLGWSIIRIWSTDWFGNAESVIDRTHQGLVRLLEEDRKQRVAQAAPVQPPDDELATGEDAELEDGPAAGGGHGERTASDTRQWGAAAHRASELSSSPAASAEAAEISRPAGQFASASSQGDAAAGAFDLDADRFFEAAYSDSLQALILSIVAADGPMPLRELARRVAHRHGWQRVGKRILGRVQESLGPVERHPEGDVDFVWEPGSHAPRVPFRGLAGRPIRDISRSEVASAIDDNEERISGADDPMQALARLLGIVRLTDGMRAYLAGCVAWRERNRADGGCRAG